MSDNFYKFCPPLIDDSGRSFTDFMTASLRDEMNKVELNIWRDDEMRIKYQQNGLQMLNNDWAALQKRAACRANRCVHNFPSLSTPADFANEMAAYNRSRQTNQPYGVCKVYSDQRLFNKC